MKRFVYRVLDPEEWLILKKKVFHGNDFDQRSGYIHLSQKDQLRKTIDIYLKKKIVILKIRTKNLKQSCYGKPHGQEKIPHLYDKLTLESVVKADYPNV